MLTYGLERKNSKNFEFYQCHILTVSLISFFFVGRGEYTIQVTPNWNVSQYLMTLKRFSFKVFSSRLLCHTAFKRLPNYREISLAESYTYTTLHYTYTKSFNVIESHNVTELLG